MSSPAFNRGGGSSELLRLCARAPPGWHDYTSPPLLTNCMWWAVVGWLECRKIALAQRYIDGGTTAESTCQECPGGEYMGEDVADGHRETTECKPMPVYLIDVVTTPCVSVSLRRAPMNSTTLLAWCQAVRQ